MIYDYDEHIIRMIKFTFEVDSVPVHVSDKVSAANDLEPPRIISRIH